MSISETNLGKGPKVPGTATTRTPLARHVPATPAPVNRAAIDTLLHEARLGVSAWTAELRDPETERGFRAAAFAPLGTLRCVAALLAAVGVAAFVNPFRAEAVDPRARAAVVGVAALLLLTALGGVVVGAVVLASTAAEGSPIALKRRGEWVLPPSHVAVRWSRSFAFDAFLAVLLGGSILLASVAERLGPEHTDALPFRAFFAFLVMLSAGSARGAAFHFLLAALGACGGDTPHTRAPHEPILALVGGVSLLVLLFHVHATARVAFVERQLFRRVWSRSGAEALNWHRLAGETFFFREQHLKESVSRAVMESTIGYASHEIRNPLFVLKNLGQDLLERRAHTEDEEDLRAILRAVEHMIRVTSDVLDHQKLVNGKLQIALGSCELRRTTESLVDTHSRGSGFPIHCVFDEELPPLVWTDELRLSQILTNALANATRHLGGGDRASLSVFVRVLPASEPHPSATVRVEVRNSSEEGLGGVPAETLFAPFEQGHSPQETLARGTGLGLPICRLLAELLGGRVDLFDEPVTRPEEELRARHSAASSPTFATAFPEPARYPTGTVRGRVVVQTLAEEDAMRIHRQRFLFDVHGLRTTCFVLELPLALPPPRAPTPSKPPTPSSPASPCASAGSLVQLLPSHRAPVLAAPPSIPVTRPPRAPRHRGQGSATKLGLAVLVVDDDPAIRIVISRMLRDRLGCRVSLCTDGDEVLPSIRASPEPFDLILLDIMMERERGDVTARALRAEGIRTPLVAATGNTTAANCESYAEVFDAVLQKPFDATQLLDTIQRVRHAGTKKHEPDEAKP